MPEDKLNLAATTFPIGSGIGSTQDAQFEVALDAETFEQRQDRGSDGVD
jgi:hypothetical protein